MPRRDAVRKLSRLGNELHLTAAIEAIRLWPGHYDWGAVMTLVVRRCVDDWIECDAFEAPASPSRSVSIRAIATSLNRPLTTIHRYVHGLMATGALIDADGGIAVSANEAFAPVVSEYMTLAHDSFVRLIEDLHGDSAFAAPVREPTSDLRKHTLIAALDAWLIPFEYASELVTDWTSKLVWIVIVVANVRHVTVNPSLSDTYAHDPTPDAIRKPIPLRRIMALTGLPYGTAYRHCKALEALDVVRYERGGWLLVSRQLGDDRVDQGVRALLAYFRKRIDGLVSYGFDPAHAAGFYIRGRPEYVPIQID